MSQWVLLEENKNIEYSLTDQTAKININTEKYTVSRLYNDIGIVEPGYNYSFKINVESNADIKIFYIFYDENNEEYSKGYLKKEDIITVPQKAVTAKIEVLILSDKESETFISDIEFIKKEKVKKRNVKIVSIPHGNYGMELKTLEENYFNIIKDIDKASEYKPDMIVLTECVFHTRCLPGENGYFHTLSDKYVTMLREKAREYNTYIACSIKMLDEDNNLRNAGLLIDRNGEISGIHYKSHLTIGEYEEGVLPGNEIEVFETDFGKISILICWEHFFPEVVRTAVLKGAELILVPTRGFTMERTLTRADENGCYIATSQYKVGTVITDPTGKVLANAETGDFAVAEIDLNEFAFVPWLSCDSNGLPNNIYLNERRPEIYNILTNKKQGE